MKTTSKSLQAIQIALSRGYRIDDNGNVFGSRGKILKPLHFGDGYFAFKVMSSRKKYNIKYHKFQAFRKYGRRAFDGFKSCIRHLDGDKKNNHINNIILGTFKENSLDIPKEKRIARTLKSWETRKNEKEEN